MAGSRRLIVLPDDSAKPILDVIAEAKKTLSVKMFLFSDPALLKAVIAASHRGVKVRVMLNPARRSERIREQRIPQAPGGRGSARHGQQPGLRRDA